MAVGTKAYVQSRSMLPSQRHAFCTILALLATYNDTAVMESNLALPK